MPCDTVSLLFYVASCFTIIGLLVYFDRIYKRVPENSKEPADEESRKMYFETFKTVITAAGLAIPVIGATLKNAPVDTLWMLKRAALCLLLAVALSIITLLEMSRRYEKVRQGDQRALETTLAESAKTIAEKIKSGPQGDYTEALKLTLDFCRSKTATPGLPKKDIGALCLWAYFSLVGFLIGLLYVVRFVTCF
jgi:hypothetical protein